MEKRHPNSSTTVHSFSIACASVRRVNKNKHYSAKDYEVYLRKNLSLPTYQTGVDREPLKEVLDNLQENVGLYGTTAYPLTVTTTKHDLTLLYAIPVSNQDVPTQAGKFNTISQLLEISEQFQLEHRTRSMITALDLWLRERHALPFVSVDTVFLCSREGEGVGGLVRAIIENPIHQSHLRPPEDNLVISLNNPVFEKSTTQDTTITSNA